MKLSLKSRSVPLTLETDDGEFELQITKFSVADAQRREDLMKPFFDDDSLDAYKKLNAFNVARIMCSVKQEDGCYFFPNTIEETLATMDIETANELAKQVDNLNPLPQLDDSKKETKLDAKKKKS